MSKQTTPTCDTCIYIYISQCTSKAFCEHPGLHNKPLHDCFLGYDSDGRVRKPSIKGLKVDWCPIVKKVKTKK